MHGAGGSGTLFHIFDLQRFRKNPRQNADGAAAVALGEMLTRDADLSTRFEDGGEEMPTHLSESAGEDTGAPNAA